MEGRSKRGKENGISEMQVGLKDEVMTAEWIDGRREGKREGHIRVADWFERHLRTMRKGKGD